MKKNFLKYIKLKKKEQVKSYFVFEIKSPPEDFNLFKISNTQKFLVVLNKRKNYFALNSFCCLIYNML